jgi:hypothetical protein
MSEQDGSGSPVAKDERELSIGLELGTGALLPGGKLSFTFRRLWDERGKQFLAQTSDYAGADEEALADRVAESKRFGDLLAAAGRKAMSVHDVTLTDWLARLVAAAFRDDAKIDTAAFLVDTLAQLEPVHLRVLLTVRMWSNTGKRTEVRLAREVGAEPAVVAAATARLESLGLLQSGRTGAETSYGDLERDPERVVQVSNLGNRLLKLCEETASEPE